MKQRKRIGLVLTYRNTNYGAQLQAFATQYIVESLGVETEIVQRRSRVIDFIFVEYCWGLLRFAFNYIIPKKRKVKEDANNDPIFMENKKAREKVEKEFIKRRLHNIKIYDGYLNLKKAGKNFDAVLIGSDQLWLPGFSFGNTLSLKFAPKSTRKISYATSLGVSTFPKYFWKSSRKVWKSIDYLSVREEEGAAIIRQICGSDINVQVVVDPTYLLTREQWCGLIPNEIKSKEKYVFCYFLGDEKSPKEIARKFADNKNLKLISLLSDESISTIDQTYADELVTGNTPEDFINWIRGAEYVMTDSFHGLAFSVINEKQFFVFYRHRAGTQSRHSRIDNILRKWNLSDRLVLEPMNVVDLEDKTEIDYVKVTEIVKQEREKSLMFLNKALTF